MQYLSLYSVRLPTIDAQYILCIDDLIISHLSERMVYSVIVKEKRKENTRMCQSHDQRVIMLIWIIRLKDRLILLATNILTLVERLLAPFSKCQITSVLLSINQSILLSIERVVNRQLIGIIRQSFRFFLGEFLYVTRSLLKAGLRMLLKSFNCKLNVTSRSSLQ